MWRKLFSLNYFGYKVDFYRDEVKPMLINRDNLQCDGSGNDQQECEELTVCKLTGWKHAMAL